MEITAGDMGGETARVVVDDTGAATVFTGSSAHGQGHHTAWAMLVQDELGIPMESITVVHGDTDAIPEAIGTFGSRSLQLGGTAVVQAAGVVKEQARRLAAEMIEAAEADLELDTARGTWQVRGDPASALGWGQIAERAGPDGLAADARFDASAPTFPFGAHLAVAEVDTETGKATLVRHVTVDDAGRILNPVLAEGQRHGGIAQGVAQALLEEVRYDPDGNPLTSTLVDYAAITATELPSFELVASETPTTDQPAGRQGHRRGGDHRIDPGGAERRHRRRIPPGRTAHRHASHTGKGVDRYQRSEGWPVKVAISVNGRQVEAEVEDRLLLAHFVREVAGLTATNIGCDTTSCGACTVLLDGESVKSCTVLAAQADGHEVTTCEGLAGADGRWHAVQQGFHAEHGLQCGFCTPGMMMAAVSLLAENPDPTEEEVRTGLEGNICRCTGYHNIVRAVLAAARDGQPAEEAS